MQKLDNSQKVYISLPKQDYIEVPTEEIIIKEESNFLQKIIKNIINLFK